MSATRGALERLLNHIWYGDSLLSWCLIPLTWPVRWVIHRRRQRAAPKGSTPAGVTVIVVGGLTAGGTGKTPVLIGLGKWLAERGIALAWSAVAMAVRMALSPIASRQSTPPLLWVMSRS